MVAFWLVVTRRDFLERTLFASTVFLQPPANARLLGTIPLGTTGGATTPPFGRVLGTGLDARLFTDLSTLSADKPDSLLTPADRFFVRTSAPPGLRRDGWTIRLDGQVASPLDLDFATVDSLTARGGRYLLECSGNVDQSNYGLLSTADWDGVPLARVLEHARPASPDHRVLVSGLDHEASAAGTSIPGASWIFARADLDRALLATRMNGAPLPPNHGAPVRLIVPGWYGCACIKWVNRIELVRDDAPATMQMREFAARTHQVGVPALARDYERAVIDTAAMPVRVEKWTEGSRVFYRVVGIIWGGATPTDALSIRFKSGTPWVRVEHCPLPESTLTWSLWTHTWKPASPGRYQIVLKVDDPTIRTRRLDIFFYVREVEIDET